MQVVGGRSASGARTDPLLRVEIYGPSYVGQTRPTIETAPPAIRYGQGLQVVVGNANQIQRVALMRCVSVTYGFDSDQRYVGLAVTLNGHARSVTAPPDGRIAPPGVYILWVVTSNNRPCALARSSGSRTSERCSIPIAAPFSVHEVPVAGQPAYSYYALYFILEGFLPSKADEPIEEPEIELEEILRFRFPSGS